MRFPLCRVNVLESCFPSLVDGKCWRSIASRRFDMRWESGFEARNKVSKEEIKTKVPVLIVGAGPVGLSLSILLSKFGISSMLVEQKLELSQHPQAHFINNRTMEIFRKMDGLETEIRSWQPPLDQWRNFVYCSNLSGPVFGTVDHLQPQDDKLEWTSPTSIAHFSQHRLLPLLFKRAQELSLSLHLANDSGRDDKYNGILMGHKLVSLEASPSGVRAKVSASMDGLNVLKEFECSYLVATDGAGSSVRRWMGVGMEGEAELQNLLSVHFLSKDLGQYLLINQPGMLYFVFNTRVIAVIVAHNLELGEFVAQIPYYPPHQLMEDFTEEVCRELICDIAGMKDLVMEVKTIRAWVMSAQVADTFICGHGRVILGGDAAHRFPPAGGFGMNTGIQDVHNLAWKLAAVLSGYVSPEFLFTYEAERRPIAKANSALSVANFKAALAIPVALGLDPAAARMAQKIVTGGASWLPHKFQSAILSGLFTVGRLQVSPVVLNSFGASRVTRVQKILQQGHSLQLQFPAEDLGFRYLSGAILIESSNSIELQSKESKEQGQEHKPSKGPGSRLPHCSISSLGLHSDHLKKAPFSTLDLVRSDRLAFLLIVGPGRSGCCWADAALRAGKTCEVPVNVAVLWPKGSAERLRESTEDSTLTEEEDYTLYGWGYQYRESVVQVEDCFSSWWDLSREAFLGATLVRPDDHIAWEVTRQADSESSSRIEGVFKRILRT